MDPLRKALYERLDGDATLRALLSSDAEVIHHKLAPESAKPPYVVFHKVSGTRQWMFQDGELRWPLWNVQAIDRGESANTAEAIDERIDALLTDAPLAVEGFSLLWIRREMDTPEPPEADSGEILHKVGGIYRIALDPS